MSLDTIKEFTTHCEISRGDLATPAVITIKYTLNSTEPVECRIVAQKNDIPHSLRGFGIVEDRSHCYQIRGDLASGKQFAIIEFNALTTTHSTNQFIWEGHAEFYVEGDLTEFDATHGKITCYATTTPSLLASSRNVYSLQSDGTVDLWKRGNDEWLQWNSELGVAEYRETYSLFTEKHGLDKALVRTAKSQVVINCDVTGSISLEKICTNMDAALNDTYWLLSFLNKRRLDWYEAQIVFEPNDDSSRGLRVYARRRQWFGYEDITAQTLSWHEVPIRRESLYDCFQHVLTNLRNSKIRKNIETAMTQLVISYEQGYFESRLVNAYAALEALISGTTSQREATSLLPNQQFKKLRKAIKAIIEEQVQDVETREGIIKKLPELQRRGIRDQLMMLLKQDGVEFQKLWKPQKPFETELSEIFSRRNKYIHQGIIEDYSYCWPDITRIQALVTVWILKLLDCPDEAINYKGLKGKVVPYPT